MPIQRKKDVVARQVAGEHLLIPCRGSSRSVFTLNPTGFRIWELIAEPKTADELSRALASHYAVPIEQAERDVSFFLVEMKRKQLIVDVP